MKDQTVCYVIRFTDSLDFFRHAGKIINGNSDELEKTQENVLVNGDYLI